MNTFSDYLKLKIVISQTYFIVFFISNIKDVIQNVLLNIVLI